jgi:hypothetical protein
MRIITTKKMFFGRAGGAPSAKAPDDCPPALKELQSLAPWRLSACAGSSPIASEDDVVTMMRDLVDPKKTAAAFFAMGRAMSEQESRPLSEQELIQAKEISEGLQQERLTRSAKPLNASPGSIGNERLFTNDIDSA